MITNFGNGRQETTIKFLKKHLDIKNKNGLEWQALCPYHEDNSPSFSVNIRKGLFICYACGAKGNMTQLAEHLNTTAPSIESSATLEEVIETLGRLAISETITERPIVGIPYPEKFYLPLYQEKAKEYFCGERDINILAITNYRLAYDVVEDDAIIPLCDIQGRIGGFIRRVNNIPKLVNGSPKYLYPKGLGISKYLFGADVAHRSFHLSNEPSRLVITEGSIDAMSVYGSAPNTYGVAVLGARISKHQSEIIKKIAPAHIIIATDRDRAGREAEIQIKYELEKLRMGCNISCLSWDKKLGKDLAELDVFARREILLQAIKNC